MRSSLVVLAALLGAAVACTYGNMDADCTYTNQTDWSYMIFTVTWPGVFCADGCCRHPQGVQVPRDFTIHGLWPNYDGSAYPSCCQTEFDNDDLTNLINSDAALRRDLNTHWPALKKCLFVQYEFDKHGSCATASAYSGGGGLRDYLEAALYLRRRWDLLGALTDAGLKPGTTLYQPLTEVLPALEKLTGRRMRLHCDAADPHALSEVRMCVGRPPRASRAAPELIDCPPTQYDAEGCTKAGISIPDIPPFEAETQKEQRLLRCVSGRRPQYAKQPMC
eukprot:m51a1_g4803 hypothetical protein (278) ;mRNA; r:115626-116739